MTNLFTCLSNWKLKYLRVLPVKLVAFLALFLIIGSGNVWGNDATFSGWSYSSGITGGTLSGAPTGATASLTTTYSNANQLAKDNTQTLTLSGFDGCTITGVKVHVKTNASSGGGSGSLTINESSKGSLSATGVIGSSYTDKSFSITSTVVGTGKTVVITLTASANSFYCDKYTVTYTPKPARKVSFSTGTGNPTLSSRTEASGGEGITLPSTSDLTPACSDDGWYLFGWTTSAYGSSSTTTAPTTTLVGYPGAKYYPESDVTLYAVYAKVTGAGSAQALIGSYASHSGWTISDGICTNGYWILCTGHSITSPVMADLSTITSIVINTRTYGGASYKTTVVKTDSGTSVGSVNATGTSMTNQTISSPSLSGSGSLVFTSSTTTASYGPGISSITINYTATPKIYWHSPTCCTELGTISGSVSLSQLATPNPTKLKATWTMSAETGIDFYDLEVYNSSNVKVKTINDYSSGDEITGLDPCTTYYVKLYTVSEGSPYCAGGLISTSSICTTTGYTITYNTSNVLVSSGDEIEDQCDATDVAVQYSANSGYSLPGSITVTNAGTEGTDWDWEDGALYIYDLSAITGDVTVTIAGEEEGCSGAYTFAYGATANADGKNIDGATKKCFSQVGSTNEYQVTGFTIPTTTQYYWVGYNGYYYDSNIGPSGASNSGSERNRFKYLPVTYLQGSSCSDSGDDYNHAMAGAYGRLRIYSNSNAKNLYVGFEPAGYFMRIGSGTSWSNIQLTREGSSAVWKSAVMDMDVATISKKYYVQLYTGSSYSSSDEGVSINHWTDGNSTISSMSRKTNSGDNWADGVTASMRGFFRIWADNCADNGYAHFVPTHRVVFKANYPVGAVGDEPDDTYSIDVSVEESNASIALASAPTAPTSYVFDGWYDAASGGNKITTARSISAGATADITLYAHWTAQTYSITYNVPSCSGVSPTTAQENVLQTFAIGTLPTPTAVTGYTFYGWSLSEQTDETDAAPAIIDASYVPTGNTTLYAVYSRTGALKNTFTLVSDDEFVSGADYVIAAYYSENDYAIKAAVKSTYYIDQTQVTVSEDNVITNPAADIIWCITIEDALTNTVSLYNASTSKYLDIITSDSHKNLVLDATKKMFTMSSDKEDEYARTFGFESTTTSGYYIHKNTTYDEFDAGNSSSATSSPYIYLYKRDPNVFYTTAACKVLKPVISPATGSILNIESNTVTISCETAGATIYYTTDGTTPSSSNGSTYSAPFTLKGAATVKSIAVKAGLDDSDVATATYDWSRDFRLATSGTELEAGDEIIIVNTGVTYALDTTQNSNNRGATSVSEKSSDIISVADNGSIQIIKLEDAGDNKFWFNVGQKGYLCAASSSNNYLKSAAKNSAGDNGKWTIGINASNVATVTAQGTYSHNVLKNNSALFSCYESGQTDIKIYYYRAPVSPETMASFEYAVGYGPSNVQEVLVRVTDLNNNLTVTCPSNYELSLSPNSGYSTSGLTLTRDGSNNVHTKFYIRLAAGLSAGSYSGSFTISGGGMTAESRSVTGTVTAAPSGTAYRLITDEINIFPDDEIVIMNASSTHIMSTEGTNNRTALAATDNFTLVGGNVFVTGATVQNITIESCDDEWLFKVGDDSYLYAANASNNYLKAAVKNTAVNNGKWKAEIDKITGEALVFVPNSANRDTMQFNATLFSCYSTTQYDNIKLYAKPSATANVCGSPSTLAGFETTTGTASEAQSFSVKARNISTGNVTVTPPDGFEVSSTSATAGFGSSVTLTPSDGKVAPTTLWVRLKADAQIESPSGNITIAATGATTRNIAVSGTIHKFTITYHAGGSEEKSVTAWYNESVDAYSAVATCTGKVFVGWHTAEVDDVTQSSPVTNATGAIASVTEDVDLYAVYAVRNGLYVPTEEFNGLSVPDAPSYKNREVGMWSIVEGCLVKGTDYANKFHTNDTVLALQPNATGDAGRAYATTKTKIRNITGVKFKVATDDNYISYRVAYSENGSSFTELGTETYHSGIRTVQNYKISFDKKDAYIRIYVKLSSGSSKKAYIDDVQFILDESAYWYSDYSTTCDRPSSATMTITDGGSITSVASNSLPYVYTIDTITATHLSNTVPAKPGYLFSHYTIQGVNYYRGDSYVMGHDVTATTTWIGIPPTLSGTDIYVTSGKDIATTSSMSITATGDFHTSGTLTIADAVGDQGGTFSAVITDATVSTTLNATIKVTYTPNKANVSETATMTATINGQTANFTVHGRSLPSSFVVVANTGGTSWTALPADMTVANQYDGYGISLDNTTTPTTATLAPEAACYTFYGGSDGAVRLAATDGDHTLWASRSDTKIRNYALIGGATAANYQWTMTTTDNVSYTLYNANANSGAGRYLCVSNGKWGMYASGVNSFRLLPVTSTTSHINMTVTEWDESAFTFTTSDALPGDYNNVKAVYATTTDTLNVTQTGASSPYTLSIDGTDFSAHSGKTLIIQWRKGNEVRAFGTVVTPIFIKTEVSDLSAYVSEYDAESLAAMDMHISGTLNISTNTSVHNVTIASGGSLNITGSTTLHMNKLALEGGWNTAKTSYDVPRVYIADTAALQTSVSTVNYDISIDKSNYYPLAVPFRVRVADIDYAEPLLASYSTYKTHYVIKEYDGASRAESGTVDENWKVVEQKNESNEDVYLEPGRGYIITAVPVGGKAVIRIPLSIPNAWTAAGEKATIDNVYFKNRIAVTAYTGTAANAPGDAGKRHKGWNLLGVPYMSCYTAGTDMYSDDDMLIHGRVILTGGSEVFGYDMSSDVPYVSVPAHDFAEYIQTEVASAELVPGWCFFVQVGTTGTLTFLTTEQAAASDLPIYAPQRQDAAMPVNRFALQLTGADHADKTTVIVSDRYTTDYEIGADLEKLFGNSYTLATYTLAQGQPMAFNAMPENAAKQLIPVGARLPEQGVYTFALAQNAGLEHFERIDLIDYETGQLTNLLTDSYTFSAMRTQTDERFAINAVISTHNTPTDIIPPTDSGGTNIEKRIIDDKLFIFTPSAVYDVTGKRVFDINGKEGAK